MLLFLGISLYESYLHVNEKMHLRQCKHAGINRSHVTSALCKKPSVKNQQQRLEDLEKALLCISIRVDLPLALSGRFPVWRFPSCSHVGHLCLHRKDFVCLVWIILPQTAIRLGNNHQPEAKTANIWLFFALSATLTGT